jgi:hypothetical protein
LEQEALNRHATLLTSPVFGWRRKEDDWYAIKALIKFKVGKTGEAAVTQTLWFFAENTENPSAMAAKQPLLSND